MWYSYYINRNCYQKSKSKLSLSLRRDFLWHVGCTLASHADVLRRASHVPAPLTSADLSGKKRTRLPDLGSALWTLWNFPLDLTHERWRPYSFRTNYSVNLQAFVLEATLTIALEKITSEVKFTERKLVCYTAAFSVVTQRSSLLVWRSIPWRH